MKRSEWDKGQYHQWTGGREGGRNRWKAVREQEEKKERGVDAICKI